MKNLLHAAAFATMIAAFGMAAPASLAASDFRAAAAEHIEQYGAAVVTIEVISEVRFSTGSGQRESEDRREILGTMIDDKGLVVTALSNVDPGQFYARLQPASAGEQYTTTVRSLKYIYPDGREISATVVLRDPDMDLVFLRPLEAPEDELTYIDLDNHAEAGIMEEVYTIARMGRIARRTVLGMAGEIQGKVTRPRTYYIPSGELSSAGTGVPVFNASNQIVGILNYQALPGGTAARTSSDELLILVVRPTEDILEIIDQVPSDASAGERLDEAPADEAEPTEED